MTAEEQEALLLRQVVALRRSGLSQAQALGHAADGLTNGPLAIRIAAARRALTSGSPSTDLLSAEADIDALDCAARALDARLSADSALAMTRLYLTIALAGPLVLGTLLSWAGPDLLHLFESRADTPATWVVLGGLRGALSILGIPAAIGAAALVHRGSRRIAPGMGLLQAAAGLLQAAADGADPLPLLTRSTDRAYFLVRQPRVGAPRAAAELADELTREGAQAVTLFRHLAPLAAAVLAVALLGPLLAMFTLPLLSMASM
ncbi:MAG: hypothetical protein ACI8RZ_001222 [Myxococcota bacterium]|jgi:hypothetical protein